MPAAMFLPQGEPREDERCPESSRSAPDSGTGDRGAPVLPDLTRGPRAAGALNALPFCGLPRCPPGAHASASFVSATCKSKSRD